MSGAAVGALVLGVGGGLIGGAIAGSARSPGACDAVSVAAAALPSVVTVWATGPRGSGNGSGVLIDADGLIVPNDHVIAPAIANGGVAGDLAVTLVDGERLEAALVGRDPQTDLAVLQVERDGSLPTLRYGDSARSRPSSSSTAGSTTRRSASR